VKGRGKRGTLFDEPATRVLIGFLLPDVLHHYHAERRMFNRHVFGTFDGVGIGLLPERHFYRPYMPVMVADARIFPSNAFWKADRDVFAPTFNVSESA
jgi:hypothetical protein